MLTIIQNDDLDELEDLHPKLKDYDRQYVLYQNSKFSYVPRYFYEQFKYDKYKFFIDPNFTEQEIDIKYTGTLREHQKEGVQLIEHYYKNNGNINGIFEAFCGYGKTAISAYLTSILKKKTLIILDNSKLMQQWIDSYLAFTDLTIDDIGIIKGKRLNLDKPVTIATVQTLMSKVKRDLKGYYAKFREAGFGLVIYDEVHKTSSGPKFATSSLLLPTRNIIGLSATPFAYDINAVLLYNSIGNVFYVYKEYELKPKNVYFVRYDSGLGPKYGKKIAFIRDYIKSNAFYNSVIFNNKQYLEVITDLTKKCYNAGHYILIIVITIKQVDHIIHHLKLNGLDAVSVVSKLNDVNKGIDRVLVGTMKFASAAFDYPQLSALIFGSPLKGKISLIQTIGRVIRSHPGKPQPIIIDLIDQAFPSLFAKNICIKTNIIRNEFGVDESVFKDITYQPRIDNDY
jgi:superfamily II DNA or RNA helicase